MKTQLTVLTAVALFPNVAFGSACRPSKSKPSSPSSSSLSSSVSSSASISPSSSPSPLPCGSNILTNGDFSVGATGWTVGDGASISSEADCGTDFNGASIPVCGDVKLTTGSGSGSSGSLSGTARLSQTLLIGTANLGHTVFFSIQYQQPTTGSLYCGISAKANGESPGVSFSQTVNDPSEGGQWQGFSGSCVTTAATMELTCTLTVTGGSTSASAEALLADVSVEVLC